jgi:hypothetical protein
LKEACHFYNINSTKKNIFEQLQHKKNAKKWSTSQKLKEKKVLKNNKFA